MRRISFGAVLWFCLIALAVSTIALAQTQPNGKPAEYFFVLLIHPADAPPLSKEAGEQLQDEHMANIHKLSAEHKLAIAGPFLGDSLLRGIFVFRAGSAAQAQEWTDTDPAVKAGRFSTEMHGPWLIDPSAIHNPAQPSALEQYTLVLLKRGDNWNPRSPKFIDVMKQHLLCQKDDERRKSGRCWPVSIQREGRAAGRRHIPGRGGPGLPS